MKINEWKTRTRNKQVSAGLVVASLLSIVIVIGWLCGLSDASGMITAVWIGFGTWAGANSAAISYEKSKLKSREEDSSI